MLYAAHCTTKQAYLCLYPPTNLHLCQFGEFFPSIISFIEKVSIFSGIQWLINYYSLRNWLLEISAVSEILCTLLKETTLSYMLSNLVTRAMAKGIFDGKYQNQSLSNISCKLGWSIGWYQLHEVFSCFNGHLLYEEKFLVKNQNTVSFGDFHLFLLLYLSLWRSTYLLATCCNFIAQSYCSTRCAMTCSLHLLFTFVYLEAHIFCRVQCILSLVTHTGL